jgi:hypothetical protein
MSKGRDAPRRADNELGDPCDFLKCCTAAEVEAKKSMHRNPKKNVSTTVEMRNTVIRLVMAQRTRRKGRPVYPLHRREA